MQKFYSVWVGFDPREASAFAVAKYSIAKHNPGLPVHGVMLSKLQRDGLYRRPTRYSMGRMYDDLSRQAGVYNGQMSTEFAISRFFTPKLDARQYLEFAPRRWALFMDCDVFVRRPLDELFASLDDSKALYCVQHDHRPTNAVKMDGQQQVAYQRKNWSSVMAFNLYHPANYSRLTLELLNSAPGRDLHRFCWLDDDEIGALDPKWNHLVGHTKGDDPAIVHFTDGGPWFQGFRDVEFADEWCAALEDWAA